MKNIKSKDFLILYIYIQEAKPRDFREVRTSRSDQARISKTKREGVLIKK